MKTGRALYDEMRTSLEYAPVLETAIAHYGLTPGEAANRFDGLLQWMSAIPLARKGQPVQMVESIDTLWHAFVLNTKLYRCFCDRFFGRYVDHDPLDRNDAEMSKKAYARFTVTLLRDAFGASVHPAFVDLTQRVGCCYGQCGDDGGGSSVSVGGMASTSSSA